MPKSLLIFLLVGLLCLSACNPQIANRTEPTANTPILETSVSETAESTTPESTTNTNETVPSETTAPETTTPETTSPETIPPETTMPETTLPEAIQLPLPKETAEFSFLSGAGGWRTLLTLNRDGSFTGSYLDSEMGEIGEEYPHGSAYICLFSGEFIEITQISEYAYAMTLSNVTTETPVGEEWIEDDIRYVACEPYGLADPYCPEGCTEFIFYLPETPIDQVPEDFLFWWPYRYSQETDPKTTLSCYGILNVTTNDGFFYEE